MMEIDNQFHTTAAGYVAPKIYITARLSQSTVKGSTGGRVDMAIGF